MSYNNKRLCPDVLIYVIAAHGQVHKDNKAKLYFGMIACIISRA